MVRNTSIASVDKAKKLLAQEPDFLEILVTKLVQDVLEAEVEEALQAAKSERCEGRLGYRSGYYGMDRNTGIAYSPGSARGQPPTVLPWANSAPCRSIQMPWSLLRNLTSTTFNCRQRMGKGKNSGSRSRQLFHYIRHGGAIIGIDHESRVLISPFFRPGQLNTGNF